MFIDPNGNSIEINEYFDINDCINISHKDHEKLFPHKF